MAGTFVQLRFSNRRATPTELVTRLQLFAQRRLVFRSVAQLGVLSPVLGQTPEEWHAIGITPVDLELKSGEWEFDIIERTRSSRLSVEEALATWQLGPWLGLGVQYDIVPGDAGYPEIYGSVQWHFWFADSQWCHSASIYYPSSSVRHDERWDAWFLEFMGDAEAVFGSECVITS